VLERAEHLPSNDMRSLLGRRSASGPRWKCSGIELSPARLPSSSGLVVTFAAPARQAVLQVAVVREVCHRLHFVTVTTALLDRRGRDDAEAFQVGLDPQTSFEAVTSGSLRMIRTDTGSP
jgi:hypothetical protein